MLSGHTKVQKRITVHASVCMRCDAPGNVAKDSSTNAQCVCINMCNSDSDDVVGHSSTQAGKVGIKANATYTPTLNIDAAAHPGYVHYVHCCSSATISLNAAPGPQILSPSTKNHSVQCQQCVDCYNSRRTMPCTIPQQSHSPLLTQPAPLQPPTTKPSVASLSAAGPPSAHPSHRAPDCKSGQGGENRAPHCDRDRGVGG